MNSVNETIDLAGTILNGGEEVDVAKATKGSGWLTDMSNLWGDANLGREICRRHLHVCVRLRYRGETA